MNNERRPILISDSQTFGRAYVRLRVV